MSSEVSIFVRGRKRNTSTKKNFDKVADMRQADIKGKAGKEERGSGPTCAELIGGSANEVVDLFEAEDDVVSIGEIAVLLLALEVTCGGHC